MVDEHDDLLEQGHNAEDAGELARAEALYAQSVALNPDFAMGWVSLASVLLEQNGYGEVIQAAKNAEAAAAGDCVARRMALSLLGRAYLEQQRYLLAVGAFRKSLEIEPKPTTWVFLGYTFSLLDRNDDAIESYAAAVQLDPEYEEAHYNLGCQYCSRREYERAIEHFRAAIAVDPIYALAYAELGFALMRLERWIEARDVQERSIALDGAKEWPRVYLANVLWQQSDHAGAQSQYEAAIRIAPKFAFAHASLGHLLAVRSKDRARIKAAFAKALELDPQCEYALYQFGRLHLYWNKRAMGEQYLRRAAELGHQRAKKLLDGFNAYVPKQQRWRTCETCGTLLKDRTHWWCDECGTDLRIREKRMME